MPQNIAIACQGGGSHAAFTAGVLDALLSDKRLADCRIVGLSGTSGGAVCASLVWAGLVSATPDGRGEARRRLRGFWRDLEAVWPFDYWLNLWALAAARSPLTVEISPYLCLPLAEWRMEQLLRSYLDLEHLPGFPDRFPDHPKLLVGVTDVLKGEGRPLPGRTLTYDDVIASAAIPPIFRAVHARGTAYWDGLFNRNPPIREFTDIEGEDRPREIWLVRLNPQQRGEEPMTMPEIIDRRNELAGNLAVDQELYHISRINDLLCEGALKKKGYTHITLRHVQNTLELDYPSKLDRSPSNLRRLFDAGRERAGQFFERESEIRTEHLQASQKEQVTRRPGFSDGRGLQVA